MKALVYDGALNFVSDYPKPEPEEGQVLLKILLAGICNTDREVLKGYRPNFHGVLGHEFLAEIVGGEHAGQRVVGELNDGCGHCDYCKTGREHHCLERKVPGMAGRDGCFAEYMAYPKRLLHFVPETLSDEMAVLTEPLAAALQVLELHPLAPDEEVAVVGDGRLAYLITQVLALEGRAITVFGHHEEKLEAFKPFAEVATKPAGMFETVVEASGHPSGLKDALSLVKARGTILLKSTYAAQIELDMSDVVVRELTIEGSRCGPFAPALRLLERGQITLPPLELFALEDYEAALASKAFKGAFDMRGEA